MLAIRLELLKAALADDATKLRMDLAKDWAEVEEILVEFARKHGFKVVKAP